MCVEWDLGELADLVSHLANMMERHASTNAGIKEAHDISKKANAIYKRWVPPVQGLYPPDQCATRSYHWLNNKTRSAMMVAEWVSSANMWRLFVENSVNMSPGVMRDAGWEYHSPIEVPE